MYCIKKILNNNAVLAVDFERGKEVLFLGKAVGFGKKVNQLIKPDDEAATLYYLEKETEKGFSDDLINEINPFYVEISGHILEMITERFGREAVSDRILLTLADHIAFSIERTQKNLLLANPFDQDIRLIYSDEYEIASRARDYIEKRSGVALPDSEIAYIALYIHASLADSPVSDSMKLPALVRKIITEIKEEFNIDSIGTFEYNRLMYHLKCMAARVNKNAKSNEKLIAFLKENSSRAYHTAEKICDEMGELLHCHFSDAEIGYLTLHIERIGQIASES